MTITEMMKKHADLLGQMRNFLDEHEDIDLRVWWEGTMKSIKCRCQRLLLMYAAIHIVPTWPSQE